jgi:hypothetical protein
VIDPRLTGMVYCYPMPAPQPLIIALPADMLGQVGGGRGKNKRPTIPGVILADCAHVRVIAHPPCTYTSAAGYRWFKIDPDRMRKARAGYEFFMQMVNAPIPKIAVENTRGLLWQWYRKPDCVVHPYYFGDPFTKATCFWLKGLPPLHSTNTVAIKYQNWTKYYGSHTGHDRSRTFTGIAEAMAQQWGGNKMQPVQAEMFASGAA